MKFEHFPLTFKHAGKTIKATCTRWKPLKVIMYRLSFVNPTSGKEMVLVFTEHLDSPDRFKSYKLGDIRDEFAASAIKVLQKHA